MLSKLKQKKEIILLSISLLNGNCLPCDFNKPVNKNIYIFYINILSLSLAIAIRQTLESDLYEVVHPKKLHILRKREIQNNQTEKHVKEVSNGLTMVSSNETVNDLFTSRSDVTVNI